jgi:hypothetical protein
VQVQQAPAPIEHDRLLLVASDSSGSEDSSNSEAGGSPAPI